MLETKMKPDRRPILKLRFAPPAVEIPPPPAKAQPKPAPAKPEHKSHRPPKDRVLARLNELRQRFPAAFRSMDTDHIDPWPSLKIGIHVDVLAATADLPNRKLTRGAIGRYCRHALYEAGSVEGAPRIDIDGNVVGVVTVAEARKDALQRKEGVPRPRERP